MKTSSDKVIGSFKLLGPTIPLSGKEIILVRHGETLAEVFPEWIDDSQLDKSFYLPYDLNIPVEIPKRPNLKAAYKADPPLSVMGNVCSQLVAKELLQRTKRPIHQIYSSPSLACLETANAIQQMYLSMKKMPSKIRISSLLATNGVAKPFWIAPQTLKELGYSIDEEYQEENHTKELDLDSAISNIKKFLMTIISSGPSDGLVVIICDCLSMLILTSIISEKDCGISNEDPFGKSSKMFPPSATFVTDFQQGNEEDRLVRSSVKLRPITSIGFSSNICYNP